MARSKYIYVFVDAVSGDLVAAFTVKHEALTWYHNQRYGRRVALWRMPDGRFDGVIHGVEIDD